MSLDGFVSDRHGSVDRFYPDMEVLRNTEELQEEIRTTGAVVKGRRAYDMGEGDFTDYEFQAPIFVLTHRAPEQPAKGENDQLTFTFVTDATERALQQARATAGDSDIAIAGGANLIQQYLSAGLLDELQIHLVPILLGNGTRLFDHIDTQHVELEGTRVIESPGVTHLKFRVKNKQK